METLLKVEQVSKGFAGVKALIQAQLEIRAGEIHALVGENGAGKSTLIKILMGVHNKDSGSIVIDGVEQDIRSPHKAREIGRAAVYQDVLHAHHLSVGENFFMGSLPLRHGIIHWNRVYDETSKLLSKLGIHIDPRSLVSELSIARQQLVAIAKVVWQGARLIFLMSPRRF